MYESRTQRRVDSEILRGLPHATYVCQASAFSLPVYDLAYRSSTRTKTARFACPAPTINPTVPRELYPFVFFLLQFRSNQFALLHPFFKY